MSVGRVLSSLAASAAVAGCAVVAVGMSRADSTPDAAPSHSPSVAAPTSRPAFIPRTTEAAMPVAPAIRSSRPAATPRSTAAVTSHPASTPRATVAATSHAAAPPSRHVAAVVTHAAPRPAPRTSTQRVTTVRGSSLPLHYSTGSATRVITVTASSSWSTTATLQAWTKASGGGWLRYGAAVTAHVGADGIGRASESSSHTPAGSFTLTRAFGYYSDPGTPLPYTHTTPSDWWISQAGSLYNTFQRCSSGCAFTRGSPNEHLYYETPYYNYAVVIDYNTRNSPTGVRQGAGSAFFLHVTDGNPTAGCVAISQTKLVTLMRWMYPSAHPRILIGVT